MILSRYLAGWDGYDKYIYSIETDPLRIAKQPNPFVIDCGEDAKLTVKAAGGTAPYIYQWMMNGEEIDGAVGSAFIPSKGGNYRCGGIDKVFGCTGGNLYCICEYADGTEQYFRGTPLDIGCTVTLTGIGTYTAGDSASADPIAQILDLDDFSLEDAKKALPYQLKTGMDSYSALLAAQKLKKLGLEVTVTLDGASLPEPKKDEWTVTLESYDTERTLDTIKAYRDVMQAITGESIPLASAKATIQSAPCVLTEKATKEQAEQIKTALEGVGAAVTYAAYEGGGS